jgi:hypothetical protein
MDSILRVEDETKQETIRRQRKFAAGFLIGIGYSSTIKMEAAFSSDMPGSLRAT